VSAQYHHRTIVVVVSLIVGSVLLWRGAAGLIG